MRRGAPWITMALVMAVIAAVVVAAGGGGRRPTPVASIAAGDVPATTAEVVEVVCRRVFTDFADQISVDASAAVVTEDLAATAAIARAGAARDPSLQPLASGVGALLESLVTDDPGAASIALRVLTATCPK